LENITNLAGLRLDTMTQLFLPTLGSLCGEFFRRGIPTLKMRKHRAGLFSVKEKKVKSKLQVKRQQEETRVPIKYFSRIRRSMTSRKKSFSK